MEKAEGDSYRSNTVLGQLYDRVLAHPVSKKFQDNDINNLADADSGSDATLATILAAQQQLLQVPGVSPGCDNRVWRRAAAAELKVFQREVWELMTHWHVADIGE
jgi:hypothetical protein